jgi:hypothetical protein
MVDIFGETKNAPYGTTIGLKSRFNGQKLPTRSPTMVVVVWEVGAEVPMGCTFEWSNTRGFVIKAIDSSVCAQLPPEVWFNCPFCGNVLKSCVHSNSNLQLLFNNAYKLHHSIVSNIS